MKIISSHKTPLMSVAIDGAGIDIVEGAVIMRGASDETDKGCGVVGATACTDTIGILQELHDFSDTGDTTMEDGLIYVTRKVQPIYPGDIVAAEYDQSDTAAMDASVNSTSITATSLEDNIDAGWIYVVSGTGIGQLLYITASASGDSTIKSASTVTCIVGDTFIKILPVFHQYEKINTAADKIGTDDAAGSMRWIVLKNQFKIKGEEGWIDLDPTIHHNFRGGGLDTLGITFRVLLLPRDTIFNAAT